MGMTKAELVAELEREREKSTVLRETIEALGPEIRALKNRVSVEMQSGAEWRGRAVAYKNAYEHLAGYLAMGPAVKQEARNGKCE